MTIRNFAATAALAAMIIAAPHPAPAQATAPYTGQVITVGFNFCPPGWLPADGRIMPISGNEALFSLLGTAFGGDGRSNFALPDLPGRAVIGTGANSTKDVTMGSTEDLADGKDVTALALNTCIATDGIFPARQ